MAVQDDRVKAWKDRWDTSQIGFHQKDVHTALIQHVDKLFPNGKNGKVFVPLCGKTVDMKWFLDQNLSVVGLDGVRLSLEQFLSEQGLKFTTDKAPQLGEDCELFKTEGDTLHLYRGDMMSFNQNIEGLFDGVWDRGSLVALRREDIPAYAGIIKSVLKPGGRCLVEVFEYDVSIMDDMSSPKPPPPFPMSEAELKQLYEPEMKVEHLNRAERKIGSKDVHTSYYLLTKL